MEERLEKDFLVVGAGFLGGEVVRKMGRICGGVIPTRRSSCDSEIFHEKFNFFEDDIREILGKYAVDTVFFTAKVEFCSNIHLFMDSVERFVLGCADRRLIYLSSDGIFNGEEGMYREDQEPFPVTSYGVNLKIFEQTIKYHCPDHCIIRPSYIYGRSGGKLDSRIQRAISDIDNPEIKRVKRFIDMFKSPLHVVQAAEAVVKIGLSDFVGTVHVAGHRMSVCKFIFQVLSSLGQPTEKLFGVPMPEGQPEKYLPDTSLDFSLMEELTGMTPLGVDESLRIFSLRTF